jgi:hypothetical protein
MTRISLLPRFGALAAGMLLAATASAQNKPATPNAAPPATGGPAVAEQADRLIKEMSAYIGSAKEFTFHADVTFDHVLPSGQKLQFSSAEEVVLQRPGRLYVEWNGDLGARQFWYDGKSVTLYDPAMPFYASEAAPPEIDNMLDWQIWIENGPQLTPCKLVITYKNQLSQPQFAAVFSDWDFAPRVAEPVFTPELPPGTEKIPFATVTAAK